MFKKRFNKEIGETRICRVCGTEYHTHKAVWRCNKCINESQLQRLLIHPTQKKEKYPFGNNNGEATKRFFRIRREFREAWEKGREAVTAHYDKQLAEIEANGIMEWIFDRRDTQSKRLNKKTGKVYTIDNYESE